MFGPRLARALDALLWMQQADARLLVLRHGDAVASLFTEPTGTSAFEADCLTWHYLTNGFDDLSALLSSHHYALRGPIGDALDGLTLRDIRQLLWRKTEA